MWSHSRNILASHMSQHICLFNIQMLILSPLPPVLLFLRKDLGRSILTEGLPWL